MTPEIVPKWQPIPNEVNTSKAPFDGTDVLIWADSACTNIVRLASWSDGEDEGFERGWWSYRHSVTQEHLDFLKPTYWAPIRSTRAAHG